MKQFFFLFIIGLVSCCKSYAQDSLLQSQPVRAYPIDFGLQGEIRDPIAYPKKRKLIVGGISAAGYAGSLISLNKAWYSQYERSSFHIYNDSKEWLQVDKLGHAWSVYNTSRATTAAWQWARLNHKKAVLVGSLSGFAYLTVIEILDAHSARWGWSWADMGANFMGSALFAGQEATWKEQRIQYKFSAHLTNYEASLETRANDLYGESLPERLLKDYNSQTYWLSFNVKSFVPQSNFPAWLNVSVGYGATGLFGGFENKATDKDGTITFYRPDIKRQRQWYLSPDIDLTKIRTNSKLFKTALSVLNAVKIPAPALEYSNGKLKGHWFFF